jgi:hypothetical protein
VSEPAKKPRRWPKILLDVVAILLALAAAGLVVAPVFAQWSTIGVHDWDPMEADRYLLVKTISHYHQFPFWNPYSCGGHTWWGGLENGVNLVSPFFPVYMIWPLATAMRIEIAGTAALGIIGAWVFAGRFTESAGLRLITSVAFALCSRWSLQASVGHTWHLYYAWIPWALYFLDKAVALKPGDVPRPLLHTALFGATLAMMVYTGAIYPLPQTITLAATYAIACAVATRSWRPIGLTVVGGLFSFAFSAPRLLPIIDMLRRFPRLVDSNETMDIAAFIGIFTAKSDDPHPAVGPWGWHEWGAYVGWIPFLLMMASLVVARRARERAMMLAGLASIILGFGRFSKWAPWAILHDNVPIFESQHVPSRWLYPTVLVMIAATAAVLERVLARQPRRILLELAILCVAIYVGLDIGLESQRPLVNALSRQPPAVAESFGPFHQERSAPPSLRYPDGADWAPTSYPSLIANIGVIDCSTFPGLHNYIRNQDGSITGLGAKGKGEHDYRGEAYFAKGAGFASVVAWTPNAVTIHYSNAQPGDVLVLNENWDPGWTIGRHRAIDWASAAATRVDASDGELTFSYTSRFFWLGLLICVATIAGLVGFGRKKRDTVRALSNA